VALFLSRTTPINLQKTGLYNTLKGDLQTPSNQSPMKKITILLASCLFATVIFSGCDSSKKEEAQVSQLAPEISADSILDNQIFKQAVNSNDPKGCANILDEKKKEECANVINDTLLTQKAIEDMDEDTCDGIKLERYKDQCMENVKAKLALKEEKEQIEKKAIEDMGKSQEATDKGDYTICDEVGDESVRNTCKLNILVNKAIAEKNISLCEQIGVEQYIQECTSTAQDLIDTTY